MGTRADAIERLLEKDGGGKLQARLFCPPGILSSNSLREADDSALKGVAQASGETVCRQGLIRSNILGAWSPILSFATKQHECFCSCTGGRVVLLVHQYSIMGGSQARITPGTTHETRRRSLSRRRLLSSCRAFATRAFPFERLRSS